MKEVTTDIREMQKGFQENTMNNYMPTNWTILAKWINS